MTTNKLHKKSGFTLVETLIAITILLIAVVGPVSLIGDAVHKLYYAKDEMIAINLAQEGIEVVRYVRDSNMLSGQPWAKDLKDAAGNRKYMVDIGGIITGTGVATDIIMKCNNNNNDCDAPQAVFLDSGTGLYRQDVTPGPNILQTQFRRLVEISDGGSDDERKVTSTVIWKTGGDEGTITVTENIFKLVQ